MFTQLKLTVLLSTRYAAGVVHHKADMAVKKITHKIIMAEVRRIEALAQ